ncbi:MAG: hypothetical protein INF48_05705 [Rhodobacter sp.]|nr:hypothetical protein [Rhodobacter sp.]
MTNLITPQTFEFFGRYVLAGLIIIWVRSRFVIGDRPKAGEQILEAVILSLVNQLVWQIILTFFAWSSAWSHWPLIPAQVAFLLEILFLPLLLGTMAGANLSRGWNRALLRRLSMPVEHSIRRAYDYAFTQKLKPGFVILSFQDGKTIYGYFGSESMASSDPNRSDIYLERLYDVGADGQWSEQDIGRSALISLSGIRSIEFLEQETSDG